MVIEQSTIDKIKLVLPHLDERQKRIFLAAEAEQLGRGAAKELAQIFEVHPNTLTAGKKDLHSGEVLKDKDDRTRARRPPNRKKTFTEKYSDIITEIEKLLDGESYGDPSNPLRWTTKSLRNISEALAEKGFNVSHPTVGKILREMGYSLQVNQKMKQVGEESEDRDEQFQHINRRTRAFLARGNPVISVDCKKKENIGKFLDKGAEYAPENSPVEVLDHDFPLPENGKALPYGIYDIGANEGFVNVGISKDTAQFAVNSIRSWWNEMGHSRYPDATHLLITADGGGSNSGRCRLWKTELQKFANETGLEIEVAHFPPGCSKWNRIEHRLFSQISKNWRGRPLETLETIVSLIGATTTQTGLKVKCVTDDREYETGIKVTQEEMDDLILGRYEFRGEWNYIIWPQR